MKPSKAVNGWNVQQKAECSRGDRKYCNIIAVPLFKAILNERGPAAAFMDKHHARAAGDMLGALYGDRRREPANGMPGLSTNG